MGSRTLISSELTFMPDITTSGTALVSIDPTGTRGQGTEAALGYWPAALPRQRRILIHAGLHKTGTTALQQFLGVATGQLLEQNVLYPSCGRPAGSPDAHHNVAWQLGGDRRFRAAAGTLDDVAAEVSAFPGDAILSSEDFETVLSSPIRLHPLLHHPLLSKHTFTLVFYVREQASYLESLFFEMLVHGMAAEASRFCEMVLQDGKVWYEDWSFCFDYQVLHTSLSGLPAKIVTRPYVRPESGGVIADFLTFTRLVADVPQKLFTQRVNVRQSLPEMLALFLQRRLGVGVESPEILAGLLKVRSSHLSHQTRNAMAARFEGGNRHLARACGFCPEALIIPTAMPSDALPLEELFSLQTQSECLAAIERQRT
jgi:hypothetical protein